MWEVCTWGWEMENGTSIFRLLIVISILRAIPSESKSNFHQFSHTHHHCSHKSNLKIIFQIEKIIKAYEIFFLCAFFYGQQCLSKHVLK